jgi:hypothetical protein
MMNDKSEFRQNPQGHFVPVATIRDVDLLRDDLVTSTIRGALLMQQTMRRFKNGVLADIQAFMDISSEQYGIKFGGKKGNLTLSSFDGRYKIIFAISDSMTFDERLHVAKKLIDQCIHRWTKDSDSNVKALIEHAFQTDKQGNINTARVLGLLKLKIDDAEWKQAMKAISDSICVSASKSYLRFYQRVGDEGKYEQIALDMGGLI